MTDDVVIPPGTVYCFAGSSQPHARRKRTLIADNVVATARLARKLAERNVVLASSIEVYGAAPAPLAESTLSGVSRCRGRPSTAGQMRPWRLPLSRATTGGFASGART